MLSMLGYKVSSWPVYPLFNDLQRRDLNALMAEIEAHDAFDDLPWTVLYQVVDKACRGSRFILTVRDEQRWIRSMVSYNSIWPDPSRKFLLGLATPGGYEREHLEWYRQHNAEVTDYFAGRPDDFLVINWEKGDGWEEFCRFLGKAVPPQKLPHLKKMNYSALVPRLNRSMGHLVRFGRAIGIADPVFRNGAGRFDPAAPWGEPLQLSDKELWRPGPFFRIARWLSDASGY